MHAMPRDEERALLAAAQAGNLGARDRLVEHNRPFVICMVMRYRHNRSDTGDLIQMGCLGLMRAVCSYSLDNQNRFLTYAGGVIRTFISHYLDSQHRKTDPLTSLDAPRFSDRQYNPGMNKVERSRVDFVASNDNQEEQLAREELRARIREAVVAAKLPAKQLMVIRMRWLSGWDVALEDVAQSLGCTRQNANQLELRAFAKLRESMASIHEEAA